MDIILSLIFLCVGILGGLFVGLAGIGITLVTLPVLILIFTHVFLGPYSVKMAIATTLACGVIAALSATVMHIRHKNIQWPLFQKMSAIYLCTAFIGSYIVHFLATRKVEILLGCVLIAVAFKLLKRKKDTANVIGAQSIKSLSFFSTMTLAGLSNSMCGIATGTIAIPYLSKYLPHKHAAGTSLASTLIACFFGVIAYVIYGWNIPNLPSYSLGYIDVPVFIYIAIGVLIGTPLGYKLSGKLDPKWIRWALACLILGTGIFAICRGFS